MPFSLWLKGFYQNEIAMHFSLSRKLIRIKKVYVAERKQTSIFSVQELNSVIDNFTVGGTLKLEYLIMSCLNLQ